jgi:hypothetical protein
MGNELSTTTTPARGLALQSFDDALRFARMVANSEFAPKDFKGKPESCLLAIQHGSEVGLSPMQSLQSIAVINGRPTIWGDAALALVQSSPVCEYVREYAEGEGDGMVAVCEAKRRGYPAPTVSRFSMADAKRAGLLGKAGPWAQYPARMLALRARGFALRNAFADALRGLITAEEAQDYPIPATAIEPVRQAVHEPEIRTTPDDVAEVRTGRVVLNPKTKPEAALDVAARARLAIASAATVGKLDDMRRLIDARLAEGALTADQHRELVGMTLERAEILTAGDDADTEHFDADEVEAESRK